MKGKRRCSGGEFAVSFLESSPGGMGMSFKYKKKSKGVKRCEGLILPEPVKER